MKRIIDVPEQGLTACQLWIEMGVASWQDKVIANSIPYEERPQIVEMTNAEAIRQLYSLVDHCNSMHDEPGDIWEDDMKALEKAIKSLSEEIEKMKGGAEE